MARRLRIIRDGGVYHVINRRIARLPLFEKDADFQAFENVLAETHRRTPSVRILAYVAMGNHWHLLLWPARGKDLPVFMQRLTVTHMRRWHAHRGSTGDGPVYQGRFKSFPVQDDSHLLTVARYVERNPLRAGLVNRAEEWRWSSLWWRNTPADAETRPSLIDCLTPAKAWPVSPPRDYLTWVNRPETAAELASLQRSVTRGAPFGSDSWVSAAAGRFKLQSTLRDPGRPRKMGAGKGKEVVGK